MAWETQSLGNAARFVGGGTPSKKNPKFWEGEIPWVSPKDMGDWRISDSEDHITEAAIESSATQLIPKRSILIVVRSGILARKLPVGLNDRVVALNQDMKALVPSADLLP